MDEWIERYRRIINPLVRFINKRKGKTEIGKSRSYEVFLKRTQSFASRFTTFLSRQAQRQGIPWSEVRRAGVKKRFVKRQDDVAKFLNKYRALDNQFVIKRITPAGTTILDTQRILKGQKQFEAQAEYVTRNEVFTFGEREKNNSYKEEGITQFKWLTRNDSRVRDTHRKLHGKVFYFSKPPSIGGRKLLPGEDYNCRCTSVPILKKNKKSI